MNMQFEEEPVVCKDHMQIIKGKRTKRQRLPSPLRQAMPSSTASSGGSGGLFDLATTTATNFSPSASNEFRRTEIEDDNDEDMANCLILLAQGHHHHNKASKSSHAEHVANKKATTGLYIYECKTCNRCFPSFQALGGHRASHKKPKTNNIGITEDHQKQALASTTTSFVNEDDHHNYDPTTSTTLTLQISSRPLSYRSSTVSMSTPPAPPPPPPKSKVHECSICGAEFTSGQALGGHMRRHRAFLSMAATTTSSSMSGATNVNNGGAGSTHESQDKAKKPRNVLKLDLNLPAAPEDDRRESNNNKFSFQSKEKVIVFSATSLVDCHY